MCNKILLRILNLQHTILTNGWTEPLLFVLFFLLSFFEDMSFIFFPLMTNFQGLQRNFSFVDFHLITAMLFFFLFKKEWSMSKKFTCTCYGFSSWSVLRMLEYHMMPSCYSMPLATYSGKCLFLMLAHFLKYSSCK